MKRLLSLALSILLGACADSSPTAAGDASGGALQPVPRQRRVSTVARSESTIGICGDCPGARLRQ